MGQLWVEVQSLSAYCCWENGGNEGKEATAYQWEAEDDAIKRLKVCYALEVAKGILKTGCNQLDQQGAFSQ